MKTIQNSAKQPNTNMQKITKVLLIFAVGLLSIGIFDFVRWMWGTDPEGAEATSVKGTESCENLENIEIFSSVSGQKSWFLLGDEFSSEEQTLDLSTVVDESSVSNVNKLTLEYTIENTDIAGTMNHKRNSDIFTASINTASYEPGVYSLWVTAKNSCSSTTISDPFTFNVSYPVYVVWSIDWEGSDVKQEYLDNMNTIANTYGVPMTHFFNPRIYLPSVVSADRANELTQYVLDGKESRGDAIALHLHMFPDMVSAAGVEPQYNPAWGWSRTDGYDILVSGYSYDKMDSVLDWSTATFENNGLGTPTMFRAGGWFADEGTLRVLEDNGFVLDSSGRTSYTLGTNNVETHWNLLETTQPYHPSYSNQNITGDPGMDLWEFPNNGGDSWSFSKDEMYGRYRLNYAGGISTEKKIVTYLSHPDWFNVDKPKIEGLFSDINNEGYTTDSGPVVYTTLDALYHMQSEVE